MALKTIRKDSSDQKRNNIYLLFLPTMYYEKVVHMSLYYTFKYWPQMLLQTKQPSILSRQRVPHINQRATKIQGFSSLSVDVSQALLPQDKPLHKVPPWDKACPPQLSLQAPGLRSSHGLSQKFSYLYNQNCWYVPFDFFPLVINIKPCFVCIIKASIMIGSLMHFLTLFELNGL